MAIKNRSCDLRPWLVSMMIGASLSLAGCGATSRDLPPDAQRDERPAPIVPPPAPQPGHSTGAR